MSDTNQTFIDKEKKVDFLDDIRGYTKKRLSNPIIFSYTFSWILWNWKFIVFMFFSRLTIEEKLDCYNRYIDCGSWIYPIFGTLIYIFLLNYLETLSLIVSRNGFRNRIKQIEKRSLIQIDSDVKIARERVILQTARIDAEEIDRILTENTQLHYLVEDLQKRVSIYQDSEYDKNSRIHTTYETVISVSNVLKQLGHERALLHIGNPFHNKETKHLVEAEIQLLVNLGLLDNSKNLELTELGKDVFEYLKSRE